MLFSKLVLPFLTIATFGTSWWLLDFPSKEDAVPPPTYLWTNKYDPKQSIAARITPPEGFVRQSAVKGSFGEWLQQLPLKAANTPVYLYDGREKGNQSVHHAVIDLDTGDKDLQQCADAIMRLKAEYHFSRNEFEKIHFNFVSGDNVKFNDWRFGKKPVVKGNKVTWTAKTQKADNSYVNFRRYMTQIFSYAGTLSLAKELKPIDIKDIEIGDVFIRGGSPGHAVLVVDVAENPSTGQKVFMLAQSYMPAQDMHLLKNLNNPDFSPWYPLNFGTTLSTPEWDFAADQLKRFAE